MLPPYTELVRFDPAARLTGAELRAAAADSVRRHLAQAPSDNPFARFGDALQAELPQLLDGDAQGYHDYAFATVRMVGAGFEICALLSHWLLGDEDEQPAAAFTAIVDDAKLLSFKLARRRAFDPGPIVARLGTSWDEAMSGLSDALG